MDDEICIQRSDKANKKYFVRVGNKTIHFGDDRYSDFTKHHDNDRKQRYINRHKAREKWGKNGIKTAGFWSRWILWNKTSIKSSIRDTEKRFKIKIKRCNRR